MLTQENVMINRVAHEGETSVLLNRYLIEYLIIIFNNLTVYVSVILRFIENQVDRIDNKCDCYENLRASHC